MTKYTWRDIPEGGEIPPLWSCGRILSVPRLEEHYVVYMDDKGRKMFRSWGRYGAIFGKPGKVHKRRSRRYEVHE